MIFFVQEEHQIFRELRQINDPEVSREFVKHVLKENAVLAEDLNRLRKLRDDEVATRQMVLDDRLISLRRIIFGKSSEKRETLESRKRATNEQDVLFHSQCLVPTPEEKEVKG